MIISAAVAMAGTAGSVGAAAGAFGSRLETVLTRIGLQPPQVPESSDRHWTASAIVLHPDGDQVLLIDHVRSGLWLFPGVH